MKRLPARALPVRHRLRLRRMPGGQWQAGDVVAPEAKGLPPVNLTGRHSYPHLTNPLPVDTNLQEGSMETI